MKLLGLFRPTVRLRLTLLYTGLVLVLGGTLLVANYFLVRRNLTVEPAVLRQRIEIRLGHSLFSFQAPPLSEYERLERLLKEAAKGLRTEALQALQVQSAIAFAALAVASFGLGWFVSGRALRPLKQITGTARRLSEETLSERIALDGPKDELKELADTFDEMLGRLDLAFESRRRFVANASHELQTPLAVIRAELDVTLSDPDASVEDFIAMAEVVRRATERSEKLIDSLLTLARSESATIEGRPLDLGQLAGKVVSRRRSDLPDISINASLNGGVVRGDEILLERLVENLVENAVRYNRPEGWIEVGTRADENRIRLTVRNSGDKVPEGELESLFEPFRRLGPDRVAGGRGVGLGLAIVRAVAEAHGGSVSASAVPDGGLQIDVDLPAAPHELEGSMAGAQVGLTDQL